MTERILRNTAAIVTVTFYAGESSADAEGPVTVIATGGDGTELLDTTATHEGAVDSGQYSVVVPPQADLDRFEFVWTGVFDGETTVIQSTAEIVGGFYFSLAELRAYDSALTLSRFATSKLVDKRAEVEDEFEDVCGRAFVPRYYKETGLVTDGDDAIWLAKPDVLSINSLTVDGVDQLAAYVTAGLVTRDNSSSEKLNLTGAATAMSGAEVIDIEYEYGALRTPRPIKAMALKRARGLLLNLNSAIDERATTMNIPEFGTFALSTPGMRGAHTGVPDIDVVLNRYMHTSASGIGVY